MTEQVLKLHAQGKSQRNIASELDISQSKVARILRAASRGDGLSQESPLNQEVPDLSETPEPDFDREAWIDRRTFAALSVLADRATAREVASFILAHSNPNDSLTAAHVMFIRESLERLARDICCEDHQVLISGDGKNATYEVAV